MTDWDEYRVTLFKRKIREALPLMPGIRFGRSKGRCHLIIDIQWQCYVNSDEVMEYAMTRLKTEGIEAKAGAMFGCQSDLDYISIPIDQAALPERKRVLEG